MGEGAGGEGAHHFEQLNTHPIQLNRTASTSPFLPPRRNFPWALAGPVALLWALAAIIYIVSLRQQQGHFCYCLDDAYIHLAIAKHFAGAGVWGVTRDGFTSCASSLLWPLLIAGLFRLLGPHQAVPLLLNLCLATLLLAAGYRLLRRQGVPAPYIAIALSLLIIAMPLPTMIFNGMEHILQALAALLFIEYAVREIAAVPAERAGWPLALTLLAPLLVLVRFEGLFLAFAACLMLLLRRKVLPACLVGVGALLPVAVYAAISISHGWLWLPNSVLLKGSLPHLTSLPGIAAFLVLFMKRLFLVPGVGDVLLLALGVYLAGGLRSRTWWSAPQIRLLLFLLLLLSYGATAGKPVFYRYEAYLIVLGIFVLAAPFSALLAAGWPRAGTPHAMLRSTALLAALLLLLDLGGRRGVYALLRTPRACTNIYQQQVQMARFLGRYYPDAAIAANDIGAINYFNDIHCLDLVGLASMPIARKMRENKLDGAAIEEISRAAGVKVALCYRRWFRGQYPAQLA